MRITRLFLAMAVALALVSCSDDDEGSSSTTTYERVPIDLSSAAGTPFCQAFVKQVETIEAAAENDGGASRARELLAELKTSTAEMANTAPPEIKADADQFNQDVQAAADWRAFLFEQPPDAQVSASIRQYVASNCDLDVESISAQLQEKGQKECQVKKEQGADVGGMC